jgi:hypothetical protein
MPIFRSTQHLVKDPGEIFDKNWMDSNTLILSPSPKWDNKRPIKFEDVDIWEVIAETGRGRVYAAWCPYAEFYIILTPEVPELGWGIKDIEIYNSHKEVLKRIKELKIPYSLNKKWIENEEMFFYI